jgi:type II secretory pathway pseudopilin PulG
MNLRTTHYKLRTSKAFTLIEAVVYIAVFSLLVTAVGSLVLWTIRSNNKARAMRETADAMRRALDVISREVRQARSVYTPTVAADQVSLETLDLPEGEVVSFVDLYRCGTRLCVKREGQTAEAFTSAAVEVADIRFRQIASTTPAVQVALTMRYVNGQNRVELRAAMSATTTAAVR